MTITLHGFGESGNVWKCALAMRLADLPYTLAYVDFFNGEARSDSFRALNPMGEVPVWSDGDLVLTQSGVILTHIAQITGRFGGTTPEDRREIQRWLFWDNHKLSTQAGTTRFLMNFLPEDKRPEGVISFLQGRLRAAYGVLDAHLVGRDWIVGAGPTIADFSCASYLYYPEPFGFARADWPGIDAWLSRLAALPGWAHPYDMMPRAFGRAKGERP